MKYEFSTIYRQLIPKTLDTYPEENLKVKEQRERLDRTWQNQKRNRTSLASQLIPWKQLSNFKA